MFLENPNEEIKVIDTLSTPSLYNSSVETDIDFSSTVSALSAVWYKTEIKGLPILRYVLLLLFHVQE